jgi:hypothetical protein
VISFPMSLAGQSTWCGIRTAFAVQLRLQPRCPKVASHARISTKDQELDLQRDAASRARRRDCGICAGLFSQRQKGAAVRVVNHFPETGFRHDPCPGQLYGGHCPGGISMRGLIDPEIGLTRIACRAFLVTVLAMGAAVLGYLVAIRL